MTKHFTVERTLRIVVPFLGRLNRRLALLLRL